jgi:hypothetical protein
LTQVHRQEARQTTPPAVQPFAYGPAGGVTTNTMGRAVDSTGDTQRRMGSNVLAFIRSLERSTSNRLFVTLTGEARASLQKDPDGGVGDLVTSNGAAHVWFGKSWDGVEAFAARGKDQFGLPRDVNYVFSAPDFSLVTNVFDGWCATYPVKTTPEQVRALVEAWMKDYIPTGYRVAEAEICQRSRWALPFAYCRMVRYPVNRFGWCGEAMMYVRTGGNDLQPGQAEIMYFQIVPSWDIGYQGYLDLIKPDASTFNRQ